MNEYKKGDDSSILCKDCRKKYFATGEIGLIATLVINKVRPEKIIEKDSLFYFLFDREKDGENIKQFIDMYWANKIDVHPEQFINTLEVIGAMFKEIENSKNDEKF